MVKLFREKPYWQPIALTAIGAVIFNVQTELAHHYGYLEPMDTLLFLVGMGFEVAAAVLFWRQRPRRRRDA
jgi:hypothetical protein